VISHLLFLTLLSERIAAAETRLNEVNEMLKVYKTDLEEEEALLADLVRAQKSTRTTCSKEVALKFLELFPLARLDSSPSV
jgi:hypothetical protein